MFRRYRWIGAARSAAAREEAIVFARDLMRMEPDRSEWVGWVVRVTGEDQELFDLPFLEALS